jgi:hypothetical protein
MPSRAGNWIIFLMQFNVWVPVESDCCDLATSKLLPTWLLVMPDRQELRVPTV